MHACMPLSHEIFVVMIKRLFANTSSSTTTTFLLVLIMAKSFAVEQIKITVLFVARSVVVVAVDRARSSHEKGFDNSKLFRLIEELKECHGLTGRGPRSLACPIIQLFAQIA